MKVTVVGSGYVGLVTGTCFAEVGIDVWCVDIDKEKIDNLNKGIIPIYEPGLEPMIKRNVEKGRLHFTTDLASTLDGCEVVFSAVGTPPDDDGSADLKFVYQVAKDVGRNMTDHLIFVTKSTVPVGTAKDVKSILQKELDDRQVDFGFDICSNPEFLKEGDAISDFLKPDRIVVGLENDQAKETMNRLYKPFTMSGYRIIYMDVPSAEMTKYAANAMLATKISFMNDISNLCEIVGADINSVRHGIGSDSRIGTKFIYPGIGYGGSCFPKDVKALIRTGDQKGHELKILKAVEEVNELQKELMYYKAKEHFNGDLKGKKIALWGLSFKPRTDDMREASSLVLIDKFTKAGATVIAYDPVAQKETKRRIGDLIQYSEEQYETLRDADAMILATEWPEFRTPDFQRIKDLLKNPVIFDGRNIYDKKEMKQLGIDYYCVGINTKD